MGEGVETADEFSTVKQFVHRVLCSRDNLRSDCFELSHRPLVQQDAVCGWHFCLHGPRRLQLTAIWDVQKNTVWFYGSQGERFLTASAPSDPK